MEITIHIYTMEFNTTSKKNGNLRNFLRLPPPQILWSVTIWMIEWRESLTDHNLISRTLKILLWRRKKL